MLLSWISTLHERNNMQENVNLKKLMDYFLVDSLMEAQDMRRQLRRVL